jgi:hypothetical protein
MIGPPIMRTDLPARIRVGLAAWPSKEMIAFAAEFDQFSLETAPPSPTAKNKPSPLNSTQQVDGP